MTWVMICMYICYVWSDPILSTGLVLQPVLELHVVTRSPAGGFDVLGYEGLRGFFQDSKGFSKESEGFPGFRRFLGYEGVHLRNVLRCFCDSAILRFSDLLLF